MSDGKPSLADWTMGAEAIVYQSCAACGNLQYFRRSFCVACGATGPGGASAPAARQRFTLPRWFAVPPRRRPARTFPYNIVLVDTVEGFRIMAHGDNDLSIGDKVTPRGLRNSPVVSFHTSQGPNHEPS